MSTDTKTEETPKKKSKKLLIIVAIVLLLGAGGAAYMMMGSGKKAAKTAAKPAPSPGIVIPLDPVTVNLSGGHFLKFALSLQGTLTATKELNGSKAMDLAIAEFSEKSIAELSSNQGRDKVKAELVAKLEKAYPEEIMDVYFTQFVMQ
jgi:flagellar protein FliL